MIDEETMAAILGESAGGPRAKQIKDDGPAYLRPGPRRKYTSAERRERKRKKKLATRQCRGKKRKKSKRKK